MAKRQDSTALVYSVVSNDMRKAESKWADTQFVKDLLEGKTLRVAGLAKSSTLYKVARQFGKVLRTRTDGPDHQIIWMIDTATPTETETEITEIEADTVGAEA